MPRLREIWVLYRRELRIALREKNIVITSILIPIFMYPTLLWLTFTGISFVQGQIEQLVPRVAVTGDRGRLERLEPAISRSEDLELVDRPLSPSSGIDALRRGQIDVLIEVVSNENARWTDAGLRLHYDTSRDRSASGRRRVESLVDRLRGERLDEEASRLGVPTSAWQVFTTDECNVASGREMGARVLSALLPFILAIIVALATMGPAVDSTAGERERSTWETTMTLGTSRMNIVTAKYLYVATMATLGGLLNVSAMMLSVRALLRPVAGEELETLQFRVAPLAFVLLVVGTTLLALFLAAGMMLLAAFARNFREGQSMVVPLYLLIVIPLLAIQDPQLMLTPQLALVPVVNVLLMLRDAINGQIDVPLIGLTLVVQLFVVAGCLWLASTIVRLEDFIVGSYGGNLFRFVRGRWASSRGTHDSEAGRD
ncbi:MAG: ABC transporter permease [Acidobacteriota bacterium]|nr:MAG: ABC transporter permease [Acidobacteriota bacterium]